MAELPADTSNRHSEGPMTTKFEVTPPQGTDITPISQQDDSPGLQAICGAGGVTNGAKSETDKSTGKDVSTCESDGVDDATIGAAENPSSQTGAKKKKKKKRCPKSRRKISGFEEYYADAPMTPIEALENKKRYDSARPFSR
ncbi:hypothetical protein ANO14919_013630 [Xylariales sp. No.14919]|nr:hypothetical protein ANO14919_013630 [Xylariales sp. No.14919]